MDDSGQDLEMLTWAVVQTIKQLSEPVPDQNDILQKTKTGRKVFVRIFRGKIFYRILTTEEFAVKLHSKYEFLAEEN